MKRPRGVGHRDCPTPTGARIATLPRRSSVSRSRVEVDHQLVAADLVAAERAPRHPAARPVRQLRERDAQPQPPAGVLRPAVTGTTVVVPSGVRSATRPATAAPSRGAVRAAVAVRTCAQRVTSGPSSRPSRRRDGERGPGGWRARGRRAPAAARPRGWSVASLTAITAPPAAIPAATPSAIAAPPLTRCSAACAGCSSWACFWTMKFVEATILLISGRDCGQVERGRRRHVAVQVAHPGGVARLDGVDPERGGQHRLRLQLAAPGPCTPPPRGPRTRPRS